MTTLEKTEVLDALFTEWADIDQILAGLSESQWQAATPLPGWSVHDVVAHMIGTESMLCGITTPDPDIDMSTLDHVRNDIGVMNECWIRALRSDTGTDLLDRFRRVTAERRQALSEMTEDDWTAVTATPAGPDSYGRFMRVRIFDCWMHEHDIRDALQRPAAELTGPAARLALDEMAAAMGRVVGKLGGAPDGSRVQIQLTGPLQRTMNVAVNGRGQLVDDFGGVEPTVTIDLDGLLFTRLAGGRTTVARHHDAITYVGDEEVGRRIVEHLNYVI